MSNPDSFIDEVTDEVRRDKLFATFKKYGWIGAALVAVVVGGTAWTEWRKSTDAAAAQAFGDAVFAATEAADPAARRAALAAVPATGERAAVLNLLLASDPSDDSAATIAALQKIEADTTLPQVWRDLAVLRRVNLPGAGLSVVERRGLLEPIAQPGRTFRPMAAESLAYLLVEEGKPAEAITALQALTEDQEAPAGLRSRVGQIITALGGAPKQG